MRTIGEQKSTFSTGESRAVSNNCMNLSLAYSVCQRKKKKPNQWDGRMNDRVRNKSGQSFVLPDFYTCVHQNIQTNKSTHRTNFEYWENIMTSAFKWNSATALTFNLLRKFQTTLNEPKKNPSQIAVNVLLFFLYGFFFSCFILFCFIYVGIVIEFVLICLSFN